jgi:hypothetical protein
LGLAGPSETFFGHRPIFGGRLHENFLGRIYCKIFPTLSALGPTQQRNYEQFPTSALKTTAAGSGGLLSPLFLSAVSRSQQEGRVYAG